MLRKTLYAATPIYIGCFLYIRSYKDLLQRMKTKLGNKSCNKPFEVFTTVSLHLASIAVFAYFTLQRRHINKIQITNLYLIVLILYSVTYIKLRIYARKATY